MTPDSISTSASTVGLPRESRISLATTSPNELILSALFLSFQFLLRKAPALHKRVELFQGGQQLLHPVDRPGVGTLRESLVRVRMGLHENSGDAARHRGAGQHGHELALSSGRNSLPA